MYDTFVNSNKYDTFENSNKCRQQITVLLTVNGALYVLTLENSQNLSATRNSSLYMILNSFLRIIHGTNVLIGFCFVLRPTRKHDTNIVKI